MREFYDFHFFLPIALHAFKLLIALFHLLEYHLLCNPIQINILTLQILLPNHHLVKHFNIPQPRNNLRPIPIFNRNWIPQDTQLLQLCQMVQLLNMLNVNNVIKMDVEDL